MKILITRPIEEALELATTIKNLNHDPVISPLFEIVFFDNIKEDSFANYDAIIITSRNALKAISNIKNKNLQFLILGRKTTEIAKSLGFNNVKFSGINAEELKEYIQGYNKLLYLSGVDVSNNFTSLKKTIDRQIVYNAKRLEKIPSEFFEFIKFGQKKMVLFFSKRSSRSFLELIQKNHLEPYCKNLIAISLSKKIADNIKNICYKSYIAKEPTLDSMIESIKEYTNG